MTCIVSTRLARSFRSRVDAPLPYLAYSKRYASDSTKSLPFTVSRNEAKNAFDSFHRSPLTSTPRLESVDQKYAAFYLFNLTAHTEYRASIGRNMSVPYRDPQTGRIHQRQRIVWTALPQIHEIDSEYSDSDAPAQVYAGLELYEDILKKFLPINVGTLARHTSTTIQEEAFQMTPSYAEAKLRARVIEHTSQIARELLMREYGAQVKINEISVSINLKSTVRALYPLWIFNAATTSAGRSVKTLVSGVTGAVNGLRLYDPTLSGALGGTLAATGFYFAFGSPVFAVLMLGLAYFVANTLAKWLPIWRTMQSEGRRAADVLANQRRGGGSGADDDNAGGASGFAGFGNFNPFESFMGGARPAGGGGGQGRSPFGDFDPFAGAGSFNGQRRSSDPFYGYGRSQSGGSYSGSSSRSTGGGSSGSSRAQQASTDLYRTLGVSKGASQDEITAAFRKLALSKHPDKVAPEQKAAASKEFAKINEAYRVLRNAGKRDQYDKYGVV